MVLKFDDFANTLADIQPYLQVVGHENVFMASGYFELRGVEGIIDYYQVEIAVSTSYPDAEPKVMETGNRIHPRVKEMHINLDGTCCYGVWEVWLAESDDWSIQSFFNGPLQDYFLSQWYYEKKNIWPLGCWSHGRKGIFEACKGALGLQDNAPDEIVFSYLGMLSRPKIKKNWACPCGSNEKIENCHYNELILLRKNVPNFLAKNILSRIRSQDEAECLEKEGEKTKEFLLPGLPKPK